MLKRNLYLSTLLAVCFLSCIEIRTDDPEKSFRYWMSHIPKEVKVINGKYWESAHWSKEYILYLEIYATQDWLEKFHKEDSLYKSNALYGVDKDAPKWFKPPGHYKRWRSGSQVGFEFFEDRKSGHLFIWAEQL